MAHLPLAKKNLIQSSYLRFRELAILIPELDQKIWKAKCACVAGGLFFVAFGLELLVNNHDDLFKFICLSGLALSIYCWIAQSELTKKRTILLEDNDTLFKKMHDLGVYFSDSFGRIKVYSGEISDSNIVDPLCDNVYQ